MSFRNLFTTGAFLFIFLSISISQEHPSIHQIEYEKHKDLPKQESLFDLSGTDIIPFRNFDKRTPTSSVFGYFPYWKYPESVQYMQFDLLSHIAVFDFSVLSNGNLSPPSAWPWTDLINAAHVEGVKVIFGVPGLKVHSKLCLVSRTEKSGTAHYAIIGTGNFNEDETLFKLIEEIV